MSAIAVCTDSSALFPVGVAERIGVTVVPIAIALDGETFEERDDTLDDFYTRLSLGARGTTSQPSPGDFVDAYAAAATAGFDEILSIHLDARISGTVASAELAARDAPIPVSVVDTKTASFGVGLCVRRAAEALAAGGSTSVAAATARSLGDRLGNVFVAHAGPRGRVPAAPAWSLLRFADGAVASVATCGGLEEAIEAMARQVVAENRQVRAAVGHAGAATAAAADALALALESHAHVQAVERYRVGAAVGAHTGPLSFGAFWWDAT